MRKNLLQKQDVQRVSKGLHTFNSIEDSELRNRNRGVTMANLFEDNIKKGSRSVSQRGAAMILGYFAGVPEVDKKPTYQAYKQTMVQRGFEEAANAG